MARKKPQPPNGHGNSDGNGASHPPETTPGAISVFDDGPVRRRVNGNGNGEIAPAADPLREYIAGGYGSTFLGGSVAAGPNGLGVRTLSHSSDDLTRQFGPHVYDGMLGDAAVISSVNTLKQGIMAGGLQLLPSLQPDPVTGKAPEDKDQAKVELATEIKEFCQRCIDRLSRPLDDVLLEMLDALVHGNKLAEVTFEVAASGEDKGRFVFKSIRPKPRDAWGFVVDPFGQVVGILAYYYGWGLGLGSLPTAAGAGLLGGYALLPRDKFAVLSWQSRDGDPRGTSVLRAAYNPWQFKVETWPLLYKYLQLFSRPKVIATTPEKGGTVSAIDPTTGLAYPGKESVTPEEAMDLALRNFGSGDYLVLPFGCVTTLVSATGDGAAQRAAIDVFNREIALAILGTTRGTMEAQHGSKADSQTGQDQIGLHVRVGKTSVAHMVRNDLLKPLVTANRGEWNLSEEDAIELTPLVSMGETEHQDMEKMLTALASVKYATDPSQWPKIDAMVKLPVRDLAEAANAEGDPLATDIGQEGAAGSVNNPDTGATGATGANGNGTAAQRPVGPDGKPVTDTGQGGKVGGNGKPVGKAAGRLAKASAATGRSNGRAVAGSAR